MCGIVGYIGKKQAAPILLDGLSKLEYRGYDSAGMAIFDGKKINMAKATGRLKVLSELTHEGATLPGTVGIGHTRWATHGAPSDINAHPHFNEAGTIAVVHNGIIENYMKLKKKLLEKGYKFQSDTDTEVVAQLLDYYYTGDQLTMGTLAGVNLFTYCGNDPVNRKDPTGEAWYHWAIGAAVVAAAAVATVVTCGGFAAAAAAVCMVGSGVAAATTASTVAAAAFIGSAAIYGAAVLASASCSNSIEEFNAQGNWGTVAATAGGAVFSGAAAYAATRTPTTTVYRSVSNAEAQDIKNTGQFNLAPGGMESKQFGFNLSETRQFGNMIGQNTIVSARVPNSMLSQLYTGGVDTSIFRAGTLTVYGDQLGAFNQAVSGTIKFMQ